MSLKSFVLRHSLGLNTVFQVEALVLVVAYHATCVCLFGVALGVYFDSKLFILFFLNKIDINIKQIKIYTFKMSGTYQFGAYVISVTLLIVHAKVSPQLCFLSNCNYKIKVSAGSIGNIRFHVNINMYLRSIEIILETQFFCL